MDPLELGTNTTKITVTTPDVPSLPSDETDRVQGGNGRFQSRYSNLSDKRTMETPAVDESFDYAYDGDTITTNGDTLDNQDDDDDDSFYAEQEDEPGLIPTRANKVQNNKPPMATSAVSVLEYQQRLLERQKQQFLLRKQRMEASRQLDPPFAIMRRRSESPQSTIELPPANHPPDDSLEYSLSYSLSQSCSRSNSSSHVAVSSQLTPDPVLVSGMKSRNRYALDDSNSVCGSESESEYSSRSSSCASSSVKRKKRVPLPKKLLRRRSSKNASASSRYSPSAYDSSDASSASSLDDSNTFQTLEGYDDDATLQTNATPQTIPNPAIGQVDPLWSSMEEVWNVVNEKIDEILMVEQPTPIEKLPYRRQTGPPPLFNKSKILKKGKPQRKLSRIRSEVKATRGVEDLSDEDQEADVVILPKRSRSSPKPQRHMNSRVREETGTGNVALSDRNRDLLIRRKSQSPQEHYEEDDGFETDGARMQDDDEDGYRMQKSNRSRMQQDGYHMRSEMDDVIASRRRNADIPDDFRLRKSRATGRNHPQRESMDDDESGSLQKYSRMDSSDSGHYESFKHNENGSLQKFSRTRSNSFRRGKSRSKQQLGTQDRTTGGIRIIDTDARMNKENRNKESSAPEDECNTTSTETSSSSSSAGSSPESKEASSRPQQPPVQPQPQLHQQSNPSNTPQSHQENVNMCEQIRRHSEHLSKIHQECRRDPAKLIPSRSIRKYLEQQAAKSAFLMDTKRQCDECFVKSESNSNNNSGASGKPEIEDGPENASNEEEQIELWQRLLACRIGGGGGGTDDEVRLLRICDVPTAVGDEDPHLNESRTGIASTQAQDDLNTYLSEFRSTIPIVTTVESTDSATTGLVSAYVGASAGASVGAEDIVAAAGMMDDATASNAAVVMNSEPDENAESNDDEAVLGIRLPEVSETGFCTSNREDDETMNEASQEDMAEPHNFSAPILPRIIQESGQVDLDFDVAGHKRQYQLGDSSLSSRSSASTDSTSSSPPPPPSIERLSLPAEPGPVLVYAPDSRVKTSVVVTSTAPIESILRKSKYTVAAATSPRDKSSTNLLQKIIAWPKSSSKKVGGASTKSDSDTKTKKEKENTEVVSPTDRKSRIRFDLDNVSVHDIPAHGSAKKLRRTSNPKIVVTAGVDQIYEPVQWVSSLVMDDDRSGDNDDDNGCARHETVAGDGADLGIETKLSSPKKGISSPCVEESTLPSLRRSEGLKAAAQSKWDEIPTLKSKPSRLIEARQTFPPTVPLNDRHAKKLATRSTKAKPATRTRSTTPISQTSKSGRAASKPPVVPSSSSSKHNSLLKAATSVFRRGKSKHVNKSSGRSKEAPAAPSSRSMMRQSLPSKGGSYELRRTLSDPSNLATRPSNRVVSKRREEHLSNRNVTIHIVNRSSQQQLLQPEIDEQNQNRQSRSLVLDCHPMTNPAPTNVINCGTDPVVERTNRASQKQLQPLTDAQNCDLIGRDQQLYAFVPERNSMMSPAPIDVTHEGSSENESCDRALQTPPPTLTNVPVPSPSTALAAPVPVRATWADPETESGVEVSSENERMSFRSIVDDDSSYSLVLLQDLEFEDRRLDELSMDASSSARHTLTV